MPDEGIYSWDPGAHFGIYRPDTFWFAKQELMAQSAKGRTVTMLGFFVRRIMVMIPTLLAISAITFVIIQLPPGDYLTTLMTELESRGEAIDREQAPVPARDLRPRSSR